MSASGPGATPLGAPGPCFGWKLRSAPLRAVSWPEAVRWSWCGPQAIVGPLLPHSTRLTTGYLPGDRITDLLGEDKFTGLLHPFRLWVDAELGACHDVPIMGAWNLTRWRSGAALTRQFAILSFIVIGLITAALSFVISFSLRKDLLNREWGTTADFIRTEAFQALTPRDFAAPSTKAAQEHFERFYQRTVMMPEIVRVKIYDATMAVVWSDEPRLIGHRFPDNPHLVSALGGRTMVNLETGERKGENIYEPNEFALLVEVYVPIVFPRTGGVAGVVETYKTPKQVFASIRRAQLAVMSTAVGGGILLYLSLFWIVRRAARRIQEQHQALEHRTEELTAANQELRAVQKQLLEAGRMAAIGEVVTAVAHGIRNPLANIRASAQVASLDCRDCAASSLAPRNLVNIMAEVDRLEARLKELLQFVRPADGAPVRWISVWFCPGCWK